MLRGKSTYTFLVFFGVNSKRRFDTPIRLHGTDTVIIKFNGKFPKRYCHEIRKLIISYTYFSVFIGTFRAIGRF